MPCIVCNRLGGATTLLSNGSEFHGDCEEGLRRRKESLRQEEIRAAALKASIEKELKSRRSTFGRLRRLLSDAGPEESYVRNVESQADAQLRTLQAEVAQVSSKLRSLYDFWLDYPPDWQDRRTAALNEADHRCEKCGRYPRAPHVHHRMPVGRGGNHRSSNLTVLCESCHLRTHRVEAFGETRRPNTGRIQQKLLIIREAIDSGGTIQFEYSKRTGERSVRRIRPEQVRMVGPTTCVTGYCYLRRDTRTFAIHRIARLRSGKAS
jgi:hypothetical protein